MPAVVEWYATINESTRVRIYNVNISKLQTKLNTATFYSPYTMSKQDSIKIYAKNITGFDVTKTAFTGIVKNVETIERNTIFKITCTEYADILYNAYCQKNKTYRGLIKLAIKIRNPDQLNDGYLTIIQYLNRILEYQGPTKFVTSVSESSNDTTPYGNSLYIPNSDISGASGTYLPDFPMSYMTIGTAIDKFVQDILGLYYWFDYTQTSYSNMTFPLVIGTRRDLRTLVVNSTSKDYMGIISNDIVEQQTIFPVGRVVCLSKNFETFGAYGSDSAGYQIVYVITGTFNQAELTAIATRIYRDRQIDDTTKYKITFPITSMITWNAGDVFTGLGDILVSPAMEYRTNADSDAWIINTMTISDNKIEVVVGGSYISIFDVYKDRLNKADGVDLSTESVEVTYK
jgi:hypothetical protein